ncbi:Putative rRNA methylase [Alkalithermobacter thermoalcaliphilus JW-YL-7 = DSM 7308]|uniref:rRNA methylase n=1 Tax=Alkalithermobacter thermoalcaliphilus JW-YL-7 = DSM 7308 TaxID=1121328 RepID=A0A150FS13_CLOPD|nr:rRNA methylase [[Clostridium] paradoxum JW-YL-7 = DSM 7308]SHK33863.1 Putative rRNA methylase [[Clostridium] paradoxum JW-YL-7 = DSM 7308]
MRFLKSPVGISHEVVEKIVKQGDTVVDATAGNGNDTLFLAKLVGETGKVYSFDIQNVALEKTKQKLIDSNMLDNVTLINDGHENIDKYVSYPVKAVMFNLGYLPGGDHKIHTKPHTTITAIEKSLDIITKHGIVMLVIYHGGDSGFEEKDEVLEFLKGLDQKKYSVLMYNYINNINYPPIAVCIEKLKE